MIILKNFAERLEELMFDAHLKTAELAKILDVNRATVSRYLQGKLLPSVQTTIQLADYFKCSVDYLLGLSIENSSEKFKTCPPFCEQFKFLLQHYHYSVYRLVHEADMNESTLFFWKAGTHEPTIDNVVRLAKIFDCTVDSVLGREI